MSSIVVNKAGEWKLTGLEYCHGIDEQQVPPKVLSALDRYEPPEKSPVNNLKMPPNKNTNLIPSESGVDSWGLGCLIWEIFNGLLPNVNALKNPGKVKNN
jgi:SCY1-like protein 1